MSDRALRRCQRRLAVESGGAMRLRELTLRLRQGDRGEIVWCESAHPNGFLHHTFQAEPVSSDWMRRSSCGKIYCNLEHLVGVSRLVLATPHPLVRRDALQTVRMQSRCNYPGLGKPRRLACPFCWDTKALDLSETAYSTELERDYLAYCQERLPGELESYGQDL